MTGTPNVAQAIAAVMAELPSIGKADKSPEGYQYRGIEAITSRLQPLLAKHGVVLVPHAQVTSVVPSVAMRDGWQDVHMQVLWHIYGPAGDHLTAQTCGIGRDRADKGANKAHTQALKYLLLSLFAIADKADDTDGQAVSADDDRPASKPAPDTRKIVRSKTPAEDTTRIATGSTIPAATPGQLAQMNALLVQAGHATRDDKAAAIAQVIGRQIASSSELNASECAAICAHLESSTQ